jgi:hypothetical protein
MTLRSASGAQSETFAERAPPIEVVPRCPESSFGTASAVFSPSVTTTGDASGVQLGQTIKRARCRHSISAPSGAPAVDPAIAERIDIFFALASSKVFDARGISDELAVAVRPTSLQVRRVRVPPAARRRIDGNRDDWSALRSCCDGARIRAPGNPHGRQWREHPVIAHHAPPARASLPSVAPLPPAGYPSDRWQGSPHPRPARARLRSPPNARCAC